MQRLSSLSMSGGWGFILRYADGDVVKAGRGQLNHVSSWNGR
jgi:hypothetical protein